MLGNDLQAISFEALNEKGGAMRKRLFVRRPVVQVALIVLLVAVVAVVFARAQDYIWATSDTFTYSTLRAASSVTDTYNTLRAASAVSETYNTLKVYGGPDWPKPPGEPPGNMGAGSGVVTDENTGLLAEDQPYTDALAIFNPQLPQAPRKDSITWNPLFMSETETLDENQAKGLYVELFGTGINVSEKVWFRMWYEPEHWDKDLNANGEFDRDPITGEPQAPVNPTFTNIDEWYPAIMQEFTYLLMQPGPLANEPKPTYGQVGPSTRTSFVFPVGMRATDLFTDTWVVDTSSENALYGYGLTSLDGNFNDEPDIVYVESELTLQSRTGIAADFDGDGVIEPLDAGGVELSGDELAVFRLDTFEIQIDECVQFLDHLVCLNSVQDTGVVVQVWYTGALTPLNLGLQPIDRQAMLLAGTAGTQPISAGGGNTGVPAGPFFAYLDNVDPQEGKAWLMVGRALGATHSAMEYVPGSMDDRPGDPWFLKRFYVDGHEYNVVAIKTRGNNEFQFITIRTPIPKVPVNIEQHSVELQDYPVEEPLSVMPPYNYEHYTIEDVQAITAFDVSDGAVDYLGGLVGPVPPILQENGPFPYEGVYPDYPVGPYDDPRELYLRYVDEDVNPQFLGELKQKYGEELVEGQEIEFWYVEQWWTRPWQYTEFVLPDIRDDFTGPDNPDLYLLTSAFTAPQAEYLYWIQSVQGDVIFPDDSPLRYNLSWDDPNWEHDEEEDTITPVLAGWRPRVKFWFDPAVGGKKYKDENGLRVFGFDEFYSGPGNRCVTDTINIDYPVEIPPYTDPWAPFNPQLPEAPRKDSLTFNPAYMNESYHGDEPLADLFYDQINIEGNNAGEKVFFRMWYEPAYVDKILEGEVYTPTCSITVTEVYTFPAVMQEFTYMYLDMFDQPSHGQPGESQLAFPMGTAADELPAPDPSTGNLPDPLPDLARFGYGLTTFDADFDAGHDIVTVHSEKTISETMGVWVDFDGDGDVDQLDEDDLELNGNEMVIFALNKEGLEVNESVMFLDHMVTLKAISWAPGVPGSASLQFWYTGGGLQNTPGTIDTRTLEVGDIAVVSRGAVRVIPAGGNNQGDTDGAWFVYLNSVSTPNETAGLIIGRALGATHSAIDDGAGHHDLTPGDPWYLKRFFVDGHEYNVVAIKTVPADVIDEGDELYEFKYITIRTPVPKVNFVNNQDSQKLEGYNQGTVFGVDTSIISVMPPFNFRHTRADDIQALTERAVPPGEGEEELVFGNPKFYDEDCTGSSYSDPDQLVRNVISLTIRIVGEDIEAQFFGELKEKFWVEQQQPDRWSTEQFYTLPDQYTGLELQQSDRWSTEQFHTLPDQYTDLELPAGQLYLLTSDWRSDQSWMHYYSCHPITDTQEGLSVLTDGNIPYPNAVITFTGGITNTYYNASLPPYDPVRVKFWYDPEDTDGIYVGTWETTPTCVAIASSNSPVCEGETIELYGGAAGMDTYSWTGPAGFSSTDQNPTRPNATLAMSGTYTLTVTIDSCTAVATTDVTVNEKPTATASSNSPVSEGETLELYGGPAGMTSYSWTGPDSFSSTLISPTVSISATMDMAGTYTLIVTNTYGCSDSDTTYVTVVATDENQGRFVPQHSSASYSNTIEVDISVNAAGFKSGQIKLTYTSTLTCADVTGWTPNTADFPLWTWDSDTPGEEWITFSATDPVTGTYLIGTLSIHCESQDELTTELDFVEPTKLFDGGGSEIPGTWQDGTFTCEAGTCGDVAPYPVSDGIIDMGDVGLLHSYVGHPGDYSLSCEWCGDVAGCTGEINMGDVALLHSYVGYPGQYSLCCEPGAPKVVPAVSTAADNEVNLVPQDSSAPFGETADVEIWVDAADFKSGQIKLAYHPCADVEGWEPNLDDFLEITWDSDISGEEWITLRAQDPMTGTYRIGTLTIQAVLEECATILDFVESGPGPSKLFDDWGNEIPATWIDGSFRALTTYEVYLPLVMKSSQ